MWIHQLASDRVSRICKRARYLLIVWPKKMRIHRLQTGILTHLPSCPSSARLSSWSPRCRPLPSAWFSPHMTSRRSISSASTISSRFCAMLPQRPPFTSPRDSKMHHVTAMRSATSPRQPKCYEKETLRWPSNRYLPTNFSTLWIRRPKRTVKKPRTFSTWTIRRRSVPSYGKGERCCHNPTRSQWSRRPFSSQRSWASLSGARTVSLRRGTRWEQLATNRLLIPWRQVDQSSRAKSYPDALSQQKQQEKPSHCSGSVSCLLAPRPHPRAMPDQTMTTRMAGATQ